MTPEQKRKVDLVTARLTGRKYEIGLTDEQGNEIKATGYRRVPVEKPFGDTLQEVGWSVPCQWPLVCGWALFLLGEVIVSNKLTTPVQVGAHGTLRLQYGGIHQ